MRATRHLIPFAIVAALVSGCGSQGGNAGTPTATPTPTPSDNGIAALPAADILTKAVTALKGASSVHINGQITTGGKTIGLDLKVTDKNLGVGTLTMDGQTVELTRTGTNVYMKADAAFWKQFAGDKGDVIATLLQGKYLKASTTDATYGQLAGFFDLVDQMDLTGEATKGETKTINGTPAISLVEKGGDSPGTLWVATQGEPYPLRLEGPTGEGAIDFTEYNQPVDIRTPPADQVIDVSKLRPSS
jgi:hypothetical protein